MPTKPLPLSVSRRPGALEMAIGKLSLLAALATALCSAAWGVELTVANFGGANGKAQDAAFFKPFSREQKIEVTGVEYTGDLAPIRGMIEGKKITWDVVEVESTDLKTGCESGLFERVDRSTLPHASVLLPGSVQDCGVGAFVWSTVMAFDANRFKEPPRKWADFWDVQRFPGKRGLRKGARYNLEFALMADGVNRRDVYALLATEQGVTRALNKLEQLSPHIVWWESGAQPPQRLASGEVSMSTAFNGRIAAAVKNGTTQLGIVWADAIHELDYWAIVKGTPKLKVAQTFVKYATSEEPQLAFSREIPYGPTNMGAIMRGDNDRSRNTSTVPYLVDLSMASSNLPSAPSNLRRSLPFDASFWITHGSAIEKQFSQRMK